MADSRLQESERRLAGSAHDLATATVALELALTKHPADTYLHGQARERMWACYWAVREAAGDAPREVVPRSEAEALAEALEVVVAYLRTDERRPLHTTIGQTCGADICIVCAAEANAREAFDEYRSRYPKETP